MVEDVMDRLAHTTVRSVSFRARGMHCPGCEHIIEDSVHPSAQGDASATPSAASSGSNYKAPGFAGGYLLKLDDGLFC